MKSEESKKQKTLTVHQICNELKVSLSNRQLIEHRYKGKELTKSSWEKIFKEDGLSL